MPINPDQTKPIYIQVAEWLETEILSGKIRANEKIYSQYQLAEMFNINPATAAKGLNRLAEQHILYKKRGLGMFVAPEAEAIIRQRRTTETLTELVEKLITEADHLDIGKSDVIGLIKSVYRKREEEKTGNVEAGKDD